MGVTEKSLATSPAEISDNFLLESYQSSIDSGELNADPFQKEVMLELQSVYTNLMLPEPVEKRPRFGAFFSMSGSIRKRHTNKKKQTTPFKRGLYLWGGVGRGKTHLVDYFYKLLPVDKKLRLHFHRFMQLVHDDLKELDGVSDPLYEVAKNMAAQARILCLDEMHVNDITDAMLLGKLFEHLFDMGVMLVTTSNIPPAGLYKDGLQRERFLPAIKLLEQHTKVVEMGGNMDYRLRTLEEHGVYYPSSGKLSEQRLQKYFHKLAGVELHVDRTDVIINNRTIPVRMWADGVVWFSFDDLCNTARSSEDYTQIATFFHTVLVSDIPVMDKNMDDAARRFVNMIDSFYDMHVNLVVSAGADPESLYSGERLAFEFQRTASRLREMQSKDYITIKHLD